MLALLHADLYVASLEKSLVFYRDALGMKLVEDAVVEGELVEFVSDRHYRVMRIVQLRFSPMGSMVELIEFQRSSRLMDRDYLPPPHRGSLALLVEDLEGTIERLRANGVQPESSVFSLSLPCSGVSSVVFYGDPDGHVVELVAMSRRTRSVP